MSEELRERAERRIQEALARSGARDPRDFYRQRLRALREQDDRAYQRAVEHFETRTLPTVADLESDALAAWLEYGRVLAELTAEGETVQIDVTGLAAPYRPPVPLDHLVLHLPTAVREPAIPVGLPPRLSSAQRAAYDLLVRQAVE